MNDEEKKAMWEEFDTPEGFWKKMVDVAYLPECLNDRRHEATRWASSELARLREAVEWACENMTRMEPEDVQPFLTELRRRAGKEGG